MAKKENKAAKKKYLLDLRTHLKRAEGKEIEMKQRERARIAHLLSVFGGKRENKTCPFERKKTHKQKEEETRKRLTSS